MKRAVLFLVLVIMLVSVMAPVVQGFGGAYCEAAIAAHGYSWGLNVACFMEIVVDAAFDYLRSQNGF